MHENLERRRLIDAIFEQALDAPEKDRPALLEAACAGDPELRRTVEELLRPASTSTSLLEEARDSQGSLWDSIGRSLGEDQARAAALEPGKFLAHYRLLEIVGEGGMGVVWKAEDTILGRTVAVKVLSTEAAFDESRRHLFLREARLASSVIDPRIVQVHEFKRESGREYIVMEYVEGEPLDRILSGQGPLAIDRLVWLGRQMAESIARAHGKGLLHRDHKPSNLIISADGDLKIVDFGIASLFGSLDGGAGDAAPWPTEQEGVGENRIATSRLAGTLPYMAPEQLQGRAVDPGNDVYSMGVVLYEAATGRRPFTAPSVPALIDTIRSAAPVPATRLRPGIPAALQSIIHRAMAPDRTVRYRSAADMAADLRQLQRRMEIAGEDPGSGSRGRRRPLFALAALSVAGAAVALLWPWLGRVDRAPGGPGHLAVRTVLVTPLEIDAELENGAYVGQALGETLAVNLARADGLRLLPMPTGSAANGFGPGDMLATARERNADLLLTGSLSLDETMMRVRIRLRDAGTGRVLSSHEQKGPSGSLPALAAALAADIARHLGVSFEKQYEYFLQVTGGPEMARSPEFAEALGAVRRLQIDTSILTTERLVAAFPDDPDAHVLRLVALFMDAWEDGPASPQRVKFDEAALALRRIDPDNPWDDHLEAMFVWREGRVAEAIERLSLILARDDLAPAARGNIMAVRASYRTQVGDAAGALQDVEGAVALCPTDDVTLGIVTDALMQLHQPEAALLRARQAVALNPLNGQNQYALGMVLGDLGRWNEGASPLDTACDLHSSQSYCGYYAVALQAAGHEAEASIAAAHARTLPESDWGHFTLAIYYALAGDHDEALERLRDGLELSPAPDLVRRAIIEHEQLSVLSDHPGFQAIVAGGDSPDL